MGNFQLRISGDDDEDRWQSCGKKWDAVERVPTESGAAVAPSRPPFHAVTIQRCNASLAPHPRRHRYAVGFAVAGRVGTSFWLG